MQYATDVVQVRLSYSRLCSILYVGNKKLNNKTYLKHRLRKIIKESKHIFQLLFLHLGHLKQSQKNYVVLLPLTECSLDTNEVNMDFY